MGDEELDLKVCANCSIGKPLTEFSFLAKTKRHCSWCKSCNSIKAREWYEKNLEKAKEQQRKYYISKYEIIKKRTKEYSVRNKEKVRAAKKIWREKNKDKVNAASARKKAARLRATPIWANKELIDKIYHKASLLGDVHVDHIVPLRSKFVCGLHWERNLQILYGHENLAKSNITWPDMPGDII